MNFGDDRSLLQQTVLRIKEIITAKNIITVTVSDQRHMVEQQLRQIDRSLTESIIEEPLSRNTLPAIACAVTAIMRINPDATICVFPADHYIGNESALHEAIGRAVMHSQSGGITALGAKPDRAETGYGYIRRGQLLAQSLAYKIETFTEKPELEKAQSYCASEEYYWNTGIYVFRASVLMDELKALQKEIYDILQNISPLSIDTESSEMQSAYNKFPTISIDYGIMEKTDRAAVVPVEMDWNDMGTWKSYYKHMNKCSDSNVEKGNILTKDTHSSLIISEDGVVAAIGLENVAIVKSKDAVLVSSIERVEEVREIVAQLDQLKSEVEPSGTIVQRPWGSYAVLEEGVCYKIKKVIVKPHQRLSLQKHKYRAEHWVVVSGVAHVINGGREYQLTANESTYIPCGQKHRLENPGEEPLHIIEVQTGSYLGEDDIIRLDDDYNRT